MSQEFNMAPIRNTMKIRGQRANAVIVDEVSPNIVNSVVTVKATAELSREVAKELVTDTKEVDMEELLNAEANKGND